MPECPRWRLTEPHYLNVPTLPDGTRVEWEHRETARESGRAVRKLFSVPVLLDPKDPADHNYREDGEIIVALAVEGASHHRRDYIFIGKPTPGMEPLNEEAEALTEAERPKWEHPIETLPVNGGMNAAEMAFFQNMMAAAAKQAAATPVADTQTVPRAEFDELKAKFEQLLAAQATKPDAPTSPVRRA